MDEITDADSFQEETAVFLAPPPISSAIAIALVPVLAIGLDQWLGEPRRWHPLVGFGRIATWVERRLNRGSTDGATGTRSAGIAAWLLMLLPPVMFAGTLELTLRESGGVVSTAYVLASALVLYWAIGWQSLSAHVRAVDTALRADDLPLARREVARIVSRDCQTADVLSVRRAAIESTLENSSDAIIGPLFWFVVAGIPGVILYRLSNTLDAMWGYRNPRFYYFGWAAARIDDVLNLIPARLTALGFVLLGATRPALHAWRHHASLCDSPNAGPVMCAGAGALDLRLGGPCAYHGQPHPKPWFGGHRDPAIQDIKAALSLVQRCVILWVVVATLVLILSKGHLLGLLLAVAPGSHS